MIAAPHLTLPVADATGPLPLRPAVGEGDFPPMQTFTLSAPGGGEGRVRLGDVTDGRGRA